MGLLSGGFFGAVETRLHLGYCFQSGYILIFNQQRFIGKNDFG